MPKSLIPKVPEGASGGKGAQKLEWGTSLRGGCANTSSMVAPGDSFERRPRTAPAPVLRPPTPRGGRGTKGCQARPCTTLCKHSTPWGLWSLRPASFDVDYDRLNLSNKPTAKTGSARAQTPASSSDSD